MAYRSFEGTSTHGSSPIEPSSPSSSCEVLECCPPPSYEDSLDDLKYPSIISIRDSAVFSSLQRMCSLQRVCSLSSEASSSDSSWEAYCSIWARAPLIIPESLTDPTFIRGRLASSCSLMIATRTQASFNRGGPTAAAVSTAAGLIPGLRKAWSVAVRSLPVL